MVDPATRARGVELGLSTPFGFWVNGRAGAMGDVGPDVAAAAIGFMSPDQVRVEWEARRADVSPMAAALAYAESAAEWGRRVLADHLESELAELNRLAAVVIAAAQPSVGALFAGWRGLPLPDDVAGSVACRLNVLRELRGGAHLSAAHAVGLGPLGTIMSTDDPVRGGAAWAATFGWPEPYPESDPQARVKAETLTDTVCVPAFAALAPDEASLFAELVTSVRAVVEPDVTA